MTVPALIRSYGVHGSPATKLSRSGTNDCALSNQRSFDAWGNVRIGSTAGNPTGRYCANIGHRQDDESGLIYMRARYYEPTSGRFVSEDTGYQGSNWYIYCQNNPLSKSDYSGKYAIAAWLLAFALSIIVFAAIWDGGTEYYAQCDANGGVPYSWERIFAKAGRGALKGAMVAVLSAIFIPAFILTSPSIAGVGIVAGLLSVYIALCTYIIADIDGAIDELWPKKK